MSKKVMGRILICILLIAVLASLVWGIKFYVREQDSRWHMAKDIYRVHNALQRVDENTKLKSISEVRPFVITGPNGVAINYHCCITSYLDEVPTEINGLNKTVLDLVIDVDALENCRDCKVGSWDGVKGELGDLTYLCWTVSPTYSCVMEYTARTVTEEDIFHMAKSVRLIK